MSTDPLDCLLQRLNRGDLTAAEQIVRTYEPYLRTVVRRSLPRRLRIKFDSVDVVQSVWVHMLHGIRQAAWEFPDRTHLLGLLITIMRRRLISRMRRHQRALQREQSGTNVLDHFAATSQPRPSEIAQSEELWMRMLALCPPEHHELLRLKKQGLTMVEIAAQTGLHEGSVRRILKRLLRQMALEHEALPSSGY